MTKAIKRLSGGKKALPAWRMKKMKQTPEEKAAMEKQMKAMNDQLKSAVKDAAKEAAKAAGRAAAAAATNAARRAASSVWQKISSPFSRKS